MENNNDVIDLSFDFERGENSNHLKICKVSVKDNIFLDDEFLTDSEDEEQQEGGEDGCRQEDRQDGFNKEEDREEQGRQEQGRQKQGKEEQGREEDKGIEKDEGNEEDEDTEGEEGKKKNKGGRPRGSKGKTESVTVPGPRRPPAPSPVFQPRDNRTAGVLPKKKDPSSTSTRTSFYLVGKPPLAFAFSKLPKTDAVLGRLLLHLEDKGMRDAIQAVVEELKAVWLHHFGPQLILGRGVGEADNKEQDALKIVIKDHRISETLANLFKRWRNMEQDSRCPDRSSRPTFQAKLKDLKEDLEMPLNITKQKATDIIHSSGIKDWKEEVMHLNNQLSKEQVGCPGPMDFRQKKRDDRLLKTMSDSAKSAAKRQAKEEELDRKKK